MLRTKEKEYEFRKELCWGTLFAFIMLTTMLGLIFVFNEWNFWEIVTNAFSIATVIISIVLVGIILHRYASDDTREFLKIFGALVLILFAMLIINIILNEGIDNILLLPVYLRTTFCVLGLIVCIFATCLGIYTNRKLTNEMIIKKEIAKKENVDKSAEYLETICDNSIRIEFVKRKWKFSTKKEVWLGFDINNQILVFANKQDNRVLKFEKLIFMDYIDVDNSESNYKRLIKLYYLDRGNQEGIVSFNQVFVNEVDDIRFKKILEIINNTVTKKEEIVFKRKMRYLNSLLDKRGYPNNMFASDEWFPLLQSIMSKVKNLKTDGYTLFREKVIGNVDYLNDSTLQQIIRDLSKNPIDDTSAKQEAKRLCFKLYEYIEKKKV